MQQKVKKVILTDTSQNRSLDWNSNPVVLFPSSHPFPTVRRLPTAGSVDSQDQTAAHHSVVSDLVLPAADTQSTAVVASVAAAAAERASVDADTVDDSVE